MGLVVIEHGVKANIQEQRSGINWHEVLKQKGIKTYVRKTRGWHIFCDGTPCRFRIGWQIFHWKWTM
jgi:hypothetical protein